MDFVLDKQHEMARTLFRSFTEKEVKDLAHDIDEEERFPWETVKKMARYGFMGIPFPKEYGGQACDTLTYAMCVEELSRCCGTTGVIVSAHTSLCCDPINHYGTKEQKEQFLPKLCSGEEVGAFGLTEPGAGTDAGGTQTVAVLDGNNWIVNGTKVFITNAGEASVYVITAVTDKAAKGTRGISAFIVTKDDPGFSVGKKEHKMGIRASSTCELIFQDMKIPKDRLLGPLNKGFHVAMHTLDGGRVGIASQALGIAQGALDETVKYVMERKQFGKAIGSFQNTQFQLADLKVRVEAARHLIYAAAQQKQIAQEAFEKTGKEIPFGQYSAMAKLFAAETAMAVTTKCVQLYGGYGYMRDYPVERMMRDAKITEIYEGTSEVQRMVIAGAMGLK
jgi:butyryl-CoA dehydrogenase